MPFGWIYGMLFFGGVCPLVGVRFLGHPQAADKLAGLSLVVLGLSLACGLMLRQGWARWVGIASAAGMAGLAVRMIAGGAGVLEHLLLLAAIVACIMLLLPPTGRPQPGPERRSGMFTRLAGMTTGLGLAGLIAALGWPAAANTEAPNTTLPASAVVRNIEWLEFAAGLELAQAQGKPMLVEFFTTWCPYCKKMRAETWRASPVVERLRDLPTVRVNAEDGRNLGGYIGAELAAQYGVQGFPTVLLLDSGGGVLARSSGFKPPRQFIDWLEDALQRAGPVS